jgi:hypothetical protein
MATETQVDAAPETSGAPQPLAARLGTAGVILLAIASGVAAWLLSSLVNFKL